MKKLILKTLPAMILLIATATAWSGCEKKKYPIMVDWVLIGKGAMYGNGAENIESKNIVIKNAAEWQNLLSAMNSHSNISKSFAETDIDFEKFQLIVIIDSIRSSLYEVNIENIIENKYDISVYIAKIPYVATVITQPFFIVKIRKTNKNINFINS